MMKEEFLDRAKRSLRLARMHHVLRDVSAEVTDVREALAAAGSQPAAIGITEDELVALVRGGYLAEARITFDLAVDETASRTEKDFFFSELVALIAKATLAATPQRLTVREVPLTAEPAAEPVATDEEVVRYLHENDPFLANERSGAHDLRAIMEGVSEDALASIDFARLDGGTMEAVRVPDDDPDPVIEISVSDIEGEIVLEIVEPNPEYDRFAVQFFGEKDAIALGFAPAPVVVLPPPRAVPPPLPKAAHAAAPQDDA